MLGIISPLSTPEKRKQTPHNSQPSYDTYLSLLTSLKLQFLKEMDDVILCDASFSCFHKWGLNLSSSPVGQRLRMRRAEPFAGVLQLVVGEPRWEREGGVLGSSFRLGVPSLPGFSSCSFHPCNFIPVFLNARPTVNFSKVCLIRPWEERSFPNKFSRGEAYVLCARIYKWPAF